MNKKIFAVFCCLIFLLVTLPNFKANEDLETPIFNNMVLAYVKFRGSADIPIIIPNTIVCFNIAGFGFCPYIRIKISANSNMEINRLFNPSEKIILNGSNTILIVGFVGYYKEWIDFIDIRINGVGLLVIWR